MEPRPGHPRAQGRHRPDRPPGLPLYAARVLCEGLQQEEGLRRHGHPDRLRADDLGPPYGLAHDAEHSPGRGDRILEIGTGSGYQSAVLSELSDHVYTIEIIPALFRETDGIYRQLAARYPEYASITRKNADGYYGWVRHAPFQKIIVTAGIDHVPPPLLGQLAPNGIMVIPVGPPSGQTVLRIVKKPAPGGGFTFERRDIYRGRKVIFVPFTSQGGARHSLEDSGTGGGQ